jgi:hypothetical protein
MEGKFCFMISIACGNLSGMRMVLILKNQLSISIFLTIISFPNSFNDEAKQESGPLIFVNDDLYYQ